MKELKFEIHWCPYCECPMVICPRCGNNSCNGGSGPKDIDSKEPGVVGNSCPICNLAYQFFQQKWLHELPKEKCVVGPVDQEAIRKNWKEVWRGHE